MKEITLYPYQGDAVGSLRINILKGLLRQVLVAPTGAGKTIMFSYLVSRAVEKGKRVLILTDRVELLTQAGGSIAKFGVDVNHINPKNKPNVLDAQVYVSMAQTLARRLKDQKYADYLREVDLVIIDECHKTIFDKYFDYFGKHTIVVGATATPIRTGKQPSLEGFYEGLTEVLSVQEIIDLDYLVPARSYAVPVDLSKVKTKGGDYDSTSLTNHYDNEELYTGAVENYIKHANNTKALLFCSGVKNSVTIRDQFRTAGISAEHLDSENTTEKERLDILNRFEAGEFKVLCNVGILTTGYDCPSIETIILYRATKSLALFLQMCGRGSRLYDGKTHFKILDFGNNFTTHGFWESNRVWSLAKEVKSKKTKGAAPIRECTQCEALLPLSVSECEYCGFVFPIIIKKTTKVLLEELEFDEINKYSDMIGYFIHLGKKAKILGNNHHWIVRQLRDDKLLFAFAEYKGYSSPKNWVDRVLDMRTNYKR
tara:strand:- start:1035 stop:2486 length:1452 start_codon:yes stop_codon:yes gene_type:complete